MRVYLAIDRCPEDFDAPGTIHGAFLFKKSATQLVKILKTEDSYMYQYLVVESLIVKK